VAYWTGAIYEGSLTYFEARFLYSVPGYRKRFKCGPNIH
jgi:hypothetical protein